MRLAIDPKAKRVLKLASQIEVSKKVADAVELAEIDLNWQDGLPQDELEQAQVERLMATSKIPT